MDLKAFSNVSEVGVNYKMFLEQLLKWVENKYKE